MTDTYDTLLKDEIDEKKKKLIPKPITDKSRLEK